MEIVVLELKHYLKKNIFPSKTVLVFPPFNGFRRFLIHKLIEDTFASAEVAAFSIGQDINRRIVVCYKGLVRTDQSKVTPGHTQKAIKHNMIEAEGQIRQKNSPTVAVYRPPAARMAETRQRLAEIKTDLPKSVNKRSRVRRPDQQMYVPRPKRASFGEEQPRSRSRSSSRTSLENDSCEKKKSLPRHNGGETISSEAKEKVHRLSNEKDHEKSVTTIPSHLPDKKDTSVLKTNGSSPSSTKHSYVTNDSTKTGISTDMTNKCSNISLNLSTEDSCKSSTSNLKSYETNNLKVETVNLEVINQSPREIDVQISTETSVVNNMLEVPNEHKIINDDKKSNDESNMSIEEQAIKDSTSDNGDNTDSCESSENDKICHDKQAYSNEAMETISLSSDSRDSMSTTSSDTRDSSTNRSRDKEKGCVKMEIEQRQDSENKKIPMTTISRSQERNLINKNTQHDLVTSDVLIISDSSSSSNDLKCAKRQESNIKVNVEGSKKPVKEKVEKPSKRNKIVNPEDCDWESLYDDNGECLVPDLMEELTNSVGRVRVATAESDYRPYQSIEERSNDGECVVEIYDFPAEFKTSDLINIFAAYRSKNFQIKWVDDTHALGVFPSPLMADEVLACTLPYVKTRPLRLGIAESRIKARNLILPPLPSVERPKTCTALARRLVSGALGLRLPTSSQDREKEKQVLKEAREKRRLEAKQREAAWDGTLTSSSCI